MFDEISNKIKDADNPIIIQEDNEIGKNEQSINFSGEKTAFKRFMNK